MFKLYQRKMKSLIKYALVGLVCVSSSLYAQMPHDVIYMPKKTACLAVTYSNSSWKEYWENTLKRENLNMGVMSTQSVMPMVAYGISDKLNLNKFSVNNNNTSSKSLFLIIKSITAD